MDGKHKRGETKKLRGRVGLAAVACAPKIPAPPKVRCMRPEVIHFICTANCLDQKRYRRARNLVRTWSRMMLKMALALARGR
jgi:hypothetical protein